MLNAIGRFHSPFLINGKGMPFLKKISQKPTELQIPQDRKKLKTEA